MLLSHTLRVPAQLTTRKVTIHAIDTKKLIKLILINFKYLRRIRGGISWEYNLAAQGIKPQYVTSDM